jgi:hypothetical protein
MLCAAQGKSSVEDAFGIFPPVILKMQPTPSDTLEVERPCIEDSAEHITA